MLSKVDAFLSELRQPMYSRAVTSVAGGYLHVAAEPVFTTLTDTFSYELSDSDIYEGVVHTTGECTWRYLLPTPDINWSIIINYAGSYTSEEVFEIISKFSHLKYFFIALSDTVTESDERDTYTCDLLVFFPMQATNNAVNNSKAASRTMLKLLEIIHFNGGKLTNIAEMPAARLHENVAGEYIIYKAKLQVISKFNKYGMQM